MAKSRRVQKTMATKPTFDGKSRLLLKFFAIALAPMVIGGTFSANASNGLEQQATVQKSTSASTELQNSDGMPQLAKAVKTRAEADKLTAQLTSTNSAISYDPWGRLVKIVEPDGSIRQFAYSGDRLCEERDGSSAVTKQFFTWGEMIGSTKYFYTRDHLGSVTEMTDQSGNIVAQYKYDPWGNVTRIAGSGPDSDFLYAGYFYHKASGLYITRHRLYSPKLGRWLNRDPINDSTLAMMPQNPEADTAPENESAPGAPLNANFSTFQNASKSAGQMLSANHASEVPNPYKYVSNNPLSKVDPSGLRADDLGPTPCPQCTNDCNVHPSNCRLSRRWSQQQGQWLYTTYFQQSNGRTCTAYGYNGWPDTKNGYCTWLCN